METVPTPGFGPANADDRNTRLHSRDYPPPLFLKWASMSLLIDGYAGSHLVSALGRIPWPIIRKSTDQRFSDAQPMAFVHFWNRPLTVIFRLTRKQSENLKMGRLSLSIHSPTWPEPVLSFRFYTKGLMIHEKNTFSQWYKSLTSFTSHRFFF